MVDTARSSTKPLKTKPWWGKSSSHFFRLQFTEKYNFDDKQLECESDLIRLELEFILHGLYLSYF